ncbi:non-canonical purine NTP pyrophosphatase, RdgB/HAM1 family [Chthonomonas calidirosea]|uniref:dITP/XTP pyrophosphatase n=1 Tax=Chthonomonas calidirosea (strain DSM 23976 / ICMP 18418 / T49) TaxID=1303518 RepID=S0EV49_CHTCT|nr:RdgB/HAM1 family non-canonical purine NTP pyrophosphatase [Chthonomonas calidirosea]CCW34222.1 non-canonical purine NTP pyrophosphatase,RdgB/HAM1 family [Chthonomonas calidirosea T49]CEK15408.1 non-canonical purine NTP pyrophosphatase, RdgB/HAM1 family [Chthonomonas calidirosea]
MNRELLVATTNPKKGREMLQILGSYCPELTLLTLNDVEPMPIVEEAGETFYENAHLKAVSAAKHTGRIAIADDGGLVIDALNGAPGVHSHRFLGVDASFDEKMDKILELMRHVPDAERTCRFQCVVVVATPDGQEFVSEGVCEGLVAYEKRGHYGFGYDPIFYLPQLQRHMAELTPDEKHRISHRGMALQGVIPILRSLFRLDERER